MYVTVQAMTPSEAEKFGNLLPSRSLFANKHQKVQQTNTASVVVVARLVQCPAHGQNDDVVHHNMLLPKTIKLPFTHLRAIWDDDNDLQDHVVPPIGVSDGYSDDNNKEVTWEEYDNEEEPDGDLQEPVVPRLGGDDAPLYVYSDDDNDDETTRVFGSQEGKEEEEKESSPPAISGSLSPLLLDDIAYLLRNSTDVTDRINEYAKQHFRAEVLDSAPVVFTNEAPEGRKMFTVFVLSSVDVVSDMDEIMQYPMLRYRFYAKDVFDPLSTLTYWIYSKIDMRFGDTWTAPNSNDSGLVLVQKTLSLDKCPQILFSRPKTPSTVFKN
jgi:hypothetical protein